MKEKTKLKYLLIIPIIVIGFIILSFSTKVDGFLVKSIIAGLAFGLFSMAGDFLKSKDRSNQPEMEEKTKSDTRQPILFLRSFEIDNSIVPSTFGKFSDHNMLNRDFYRYKKGRTLEEELIPVIEKIGPVIAFNDKNQSETPIGAARADIPHKKWQDEFNNWVGKLDLFVLVFHDTESLIWELEQLLVVKKKVIVILPLKESQFNKNEQIPWLSKWDKLRDSYSFLPKVTPEIFAFYIKDNECELIKVKSKGWLKRVKEFEVWVRKLELTP